MKAPYAFGLTRSQVRLRTRMTGAYAIMMRGIQGAKRRTNLAIPSPGAAVCLLARTEHAKNTGELASAWELERPIPRQV